MSIDLLNNILDYARLDTAAPELEPEVFCVRDLAREVTELLSPRAHAAGLDLGVLCRPGVPASMKADAGKLRQIDHPGMARGPSRFRPTLQTVSLRGSPARVRKTGR